MLEKLVRPKLKPCIIFHTLSQATHKIVIEQLLQGKTITEVADMLDVSRTTVYNRRKEFLDHAEREGLLMAAEHYEVEDTFQKLSNLAHILELNNLEIQDAKNGCEIISLLSSFNIGDPNKFIEEVMKKAIELGISGEEITRYVSELKILEAEEKKTYKKLIDEIKDKKSEYIKIEKDLEDIKEEIKQDKEKLENQLAESDTTKKNIETFISSREKLESYDIKLEDINRLENLITNFKQHEYDLNKIVDFYDSIIILRESIDKKREENGRLGEKNKELKKENDQLEASLQKNMSMLSAVKSIEKTEIKPEEILEIVNTVTSMSQGLNLNEGEAIEKFIENVKTQYVERNNYEFQVDDLKKLQKMYQDKTYLLKEELDVLEEVISDRKNMIEAIRRVSALEISEKEIIEWSKLLKELGYDISNFRNILSELGGLPSYYELKIKEIKELEEREKILQENVKELEGKLTSSKDTLNLLQENIEIETEKIKNTVDEFEEYFNSPETGFKVRSKEIINNITEDLRGLLTGTQNEWRADLDTLDNNVERIINETERILQNAYRGGRIVGQFHSLEPISRILREEEVSKLEGTISVITMLTYIQNWLKKNKTDDIEVFDKVIKELMEDLSDIY